jgi:hypothetical protein
MERIVAEKRRDLAGFFLLGLSLAACSGQISSDTPAGQTSAGVGAPIVPVTGGLAGQSAPEPTGTTNPNTAPGTAVTPASPAGTGTLPVTPPTTPVTPATPSGTTAPTAGNADAMWCGVKRTLDARCTVCHDEKKTAGTPMSLKTHADLIAPAPSDPTKKVYQVVGVRVHDKQRPMPPQDPLTADQLASLDTWIAAGAPVGSDPTCAALNTPETGTGTTAERTWPTNCDETVTIKMSNGGGPQQVSAGQEAHPQETVAPPWGNEEVQAIAWHNKTDNAKIMHHWILYGQDNAFLFGWAPGKDWNEPIPEDTGVFLPSTPMRLDIHYNNSQGKGTEMDDTSVDICILKKANFRPKTAGTTNMLTSALINIPAKAVDYPVTGTCNHMGGTVNILSASPHAHRFAKHMKFVVRKASGMEIVMHDQAFNFEEQTTYPMKPPVVIESGDRITTTCTYTNDTDATVTFGENTGNEMCFNFAIIEPKGGLNCGFGGVTF